jgi:hypothetical protein
MVDAPQAQVVVVGVVPRARLILRCSHRDALKSSCSSESDFPVFTSASL